MRVGRKWALIAVLGTVLVVGATAAPATAAPPSAPQAHCAAGGEYAPVQAQYWNERPYIDLIELCVFEDGSATLENRTDQVWYFTGPGGVKTWTGLDKIGTMHRLSALNEPGARYMLPGERVALRVLSGMNWYLDPARTTRWMMFEQVVDAAVGKSVQGGAYLLALKSPSASALWTCTAGAYNAGKTFGDDEVTAQELVDASLTVGTSAESCGKSWNSLVKSAKRENLKIPSLSSVTAVAEETSNLNEIAKQLRALAQKF